MIVPLVTAAVAAFYLSAVPIRLAFSLRTGPDGGFGFGLAPFEARFARRRALKKNIKPPGNFSLPSKEALQAGQVALKHLHLESIRLEGVFGSGDAALTALVCGGADALGHTLRASTGRSVHLHLQPDFAAEKMHAELLGMISLRAGHIMLAALLGAFEYATGRFHQWTSTPSKAS